MPYITRITNHMGSASWQDDTAIKAFERAVEAAGRGAKDVAVQAPDGRVYQLTELPEMLARARSDADKT